MQATHRVQAMHATHATHSRTATHITVSRLAITPTLPAVPAENATPTLPEVAAEPATATLPAVATDPATATPPAAATDPATATLPAAATEPTTGPFSTATALFHPTAMRTSCAYRYAAHGARTTAEFCPPMPSDVFNVIPSTMGVGPSSSRGCPAATAGGAGTVPCS